MPFHGLGMDLFCNCTFLDKLQWPNNSIDIVLVLTCMVSTVNNKPRIFQNFIFINRKNTYLLWNTHIWGHNLAHRKEHVLHREGELGAKRQMLVSIKIAYRLMFI